MKNQLNNESNVQHSVTSTIAAVSTTPFWTAFKITAGIAMGQLVMFLVGILALTAIVMGIVLAIGYAT